jgi:hypothetical protein
MSFPPQEGVSLLKHLGPHFVYGLDLEPTLQFVRKQWVRHKQLIPSFRTCSLSQQDIRIWAECRYGGACAWAEAELYMAMRTAFILLYTKAPGPRRHFVREDLAHDHIERSPQAKGMTSRLAPGTLTVCSLSPLSIHLQAIYLDILREKWCCR